MLGIISGLISMLGWGTGDFLVAKASRKIGSVLTFFCTEIISFAIILVYFFFNFQISDITDVSKMISIIVIAAFLVTIATLSYFKGLAIGQVSIVSPLVASWSMITVLLSILFLNETLRIHQIIAVILISLGIIFVSTSFKDYRNKNKSIIFLGVKEGIISMFGYGFAIFLLTLTIKSMGWFLPSFLLRLFITIFLTIYVAINRKSLALSFKSLPWVVLVIIGLLDMSALFSYSFGVYSEYASIVAPIAASSPLITIILARLFFKEKLTLNQVFGVVITISGLILISIK